MAKKGWWGRKSAGAKTAWACGIGATVLLAAGGSVFAGLWMKHVRAVLAHNQLGHPTALPTALPPQPSASNTGAFTNSFGGDYTTLLSSLSSAPTPGTTASQGRPTPSVVTLTSNGALVTTTVTSDNNAPLTTSLPQTESQTSSAQAAPSPTGAAAQALSAQGWDVSDNTANGGNFDCAFSEDAVALNNGAMQLSILPKQNGQFAYECAQLTSKSTYLYGRFSIDFQAASHPGSVNAFFTYVEPQPGVVEELDIFEITGANMRNLQVNLWHDGWQLPQNIALDFDASAGMHNYAVEWRNESITWFVDGEQKLQVTDQSKMPRMWPAPMYVNLWKSTSNGWAGQYDASQPFPQQQAIVKSINYTPLS